MSSLKQNECTKVNTIKKVSGSQPLWAKVYIKDAAVELGFLVPL